jgi:hypothetical protein
MDVVAHPPDSFWITAIDSGNSPESLASVGLSLRARNRARRITRLARVTPYDSEHKEYPSLRRRPGPIVAKAELWSSHEKHRSSVSMLQGKIGLVILSLGNHKMAMSRALDRDELAATIFRYSSFGAIRPLLLSYGLTAKSPAGFRGRAESRSSRRHFRYAYRRWNCAARSLGLRRVSCRWRETSRSRSQRKLCARL